METKQYIDFKTELKENLIPRVEQMINKEKSHLNRLTETKKKLDNAEWYRKIFLSITSYEQIETFILRSQVSLLSLENTLNNYKQYTA